MFCKIPIPEAIRDNTPIVGIEVRFWISNLQRVFAMTATALLFSLIIAATPVEPIAQWEGQIAENDGKKFAPTGGVIFDQDSFEKLWKAWRPKEALPEVDFSKDLIVVGVVNGPNTVLMRPVLGESGNLQFNVGGPKRGGPGFGYLMMKLKRQGIKTVNGNIFQFASHDGYFASNHFEPNAAESYVLLKTQQEFDMVFGVAFVMRDKAKRLPNDAFGNSVVIGLVKRGGSLWTYNVQSIGEKDGVLEIRYDAKESKQAGATFASPLIVSIPKQDYKSIRFVENGKEVKKLTVGEGRK